MKVVKYLNHQTGDDGEKEVVELVQCPNCGKSLMILPKNFPLCDVQCSGCVFRAQVKTSTSKPKGTVFGAGWEVMDKVLKSGFLAPMLIVNYKWKEQGVQKHEIWFFPFISRRELSKRQLSSTARRANYKMFNYVGLNELPHFVLYRK